MMEDFGLTSLQIAFIFGFLVALVGDFIWLHLLLVQARRYHERRKFNYILYLTGFIASLALTASAVGALNLEFKLGMPREAFTFMASMGRGAILMTGIILLVRTPRETE